MAESAGIHIGRYELIGLIGEGAMGRVYRAHDSVLDRHVALKLMSTSIASAPDLRDRFLREARAAAKLQHPNIVTIHDFGDVDGNLYIAMELVEGRDLASIIRSHEPLSIHTKIDLILGLLGGLGYAHGQNVVHRDIKPSNIRLATDGRIKIMDFGIAHLEGAEITSTGIVLGTPEYMAPEQIQGRAVTPATDLFAVGSVLYELVTYKKPFPADNVHAILYKVITEHPTPPREIDPEIPEALQDVIAAAMSKDPKHRYANAAEMATALTTVQRGPRGSEEITTKRMPALVVASTAWVGALKPRHRVAFLAMGGTAAVAGIWAIAVFGATGQASTTETTPAAPDSTVLASDSISRSLAIAAESLARADSLARKNSARAGSVVTPPSTVSSQPPSNPAPALPVPTNETLRSHLSALLGHLEEAIRSEDTTILKQVWPRMSDSTATYWAKWFKERRNPRVLFTPRLIGRPSSSLNAMLIGNYNWLEAGKRRSATDTLYARFRFRDGVWQWVALADTPLPR